MRTVNIHAAKTHLSQLLEEVQKGEEITIAKAGKPLVKVVPLDSPEPSERRRLGFLAGKIKTPDDFDSMGREDIEQAFSGDA